MLSTVIELLGYAVTAAGAILIGALAAGFLGALAGGLTVLGPVLVVLGLAAEKPTKR